MELNLGLAPSKKKRANADFFAKRICKKKLMVLANFPITLLADGRVLRRVETAQKALLTRKIEAEIQRVHYF